MPPAGLRTPSDRPQSSRRLLRHLEVGHAVSSLNLAPYRARIRCASPGDSTTTRTARPSGGSRENTHSRSASVTAPISEAVPPRGSLCAARNALPPADRRCPGAARPPWVPARARDRSAGILRLNGGVDSLVDGNSGVHGHLGRPPDLLLVTAASSALHYDRHSRSPRHLRVCL